MPNLYIYILVCNANPVKESLISRSDQLRRIIQDYRGDTLNSTSSEGGSGRNRRKRNAISK